MITISIVINAFIVAACTAFLGWRGYNNGALRILHRVICLLSGYAASYFFTGVLAGVIKKIFSLHEFQSYLISAGILLLGVTFIVGLALSYLINHLEEQKTLEENEEEPIYISGMITGVVLGCFLGLLTVWLGAIAFDAIQLNKQGVAALSNRTADPVRKMAGDMVGGAVTYVVENKMGHDSLASDIVGQLVGDPVVISQQVLNVSRSDEIQHFFSDPTAKILMQTNNIGELQKQETFQQLMKLPETTEFFAILGTSVKESESMTREERAAQLLTDMYRKASRLTTNNRFIALSEKPEFQQMMQNPSPLAILSNPMLQELADIIFSKKISNENIITSSKSLPVLDQDYQSVDKPQWQELNSTPEQSPASGEVADDPHVIYRWTDEQGQKHFSQIKPDGNYPLEIIKNQ